MHGDVFARAVSHLVSLPRWPVRSQRTRIVRTAAAASDLNISSNANQTVESSFPKKKPKVNGAEESQGVRGWLDRRYQLTPLIEFLRHKEVPIGSHWMGWYYLGGITMFFFVVQVVTGVLLLMYYQPGEATAYESIRFLTTKVPFGWLIRSIHSWSAHSDDHFADAAHV